MNTDFKPKIWVPGDWNAFFGFGTNILVNLLTLTGLLLFVLKMPPEIVFGRILPATGLMLCLSTVYYAWLAYKLAKKTGRTKTFYAREAIEAHLDDLEDFFLAEERLKDFRSEDAIPLAEVKAELGLGD